MFHIKKFMFQLLTFVLPVHLAIKNATCVNVPQNILHILVYVMLHIKVMEWIVKRSKWKMKPEAAVGIISSVCLATFLSIDLSNCVDNLLTSLL